YCYQLTLCDSNSGRRDLNPLPPEPHSGPLPGCATSRELLVYSQPSHVNRRTAVVRLEDTGPTVPFPINRKPTTRCASGPSASVRLALPGALPGCDRGRVSAPRKSFRALRPVLMLVYSQPSHVSRRTAV